MAETFIVRRAGLPIRIDALARTIADLQTETRGRRIRLLRRHVRTRSDASRHCTRLAFTRAAAIATYAVDAEAERALVVSGAHGPLHQLRRARIHEQVAIVAACALRVVRARTEA